MYRLVKRALDIVASLLLLIVLLPFLLLLGLLIKFDSAGPVVFTQLRIGRKGKPFTLLKLRTMSQEAELVKALLAAHNELEGPVFKMRQDPRITRVGGFLRRYSLDELPQLLNVLKGDMTLVGPRPALPEEVEKYEPWQRGRLDATPGLTCIWQVSGRNLIPFDEWVRMDIQYIEQQSLWLDLKLLLLTIPAVISGRGAY